MSKIGLTLGKFAPLHKGHERLIETMLQEMDEAIVIIYDTPVTPIPLPVRAGWIRQLFPAVTVIEAWDGPERCADVQEYERREERYIRGLLGDRRLAAFYSSEYYGGHMAKALSCADRRVDPARLAVPVSGSMIREQPLAHRQYVSDAVYRDLIVKAVFVGAMSTGKSTLAQALARRHGTTFVSEYGRDYWTEHQVNRRLSMADLEAIAAGHLEREEAGFRAANRTCFIDTNAMTTLMFAQDYHGAASPLLTRMAEGCAARYDLFFLCGDDIPYDDTWDRSGEQKRGVFQRQIVADLHTRRIPYIPLEGDLETRMRTVDAVLARYVPYSNFYGRQRLGWAQGQGRTQTR